MPVLRGILVRTIRERFKMDITGKEAAKLHELQDVKAILNDDRVTYDLVDEDKKAQALSWEIAHE